MMEQSPFLLLLKMKSYWKDKIKNGAKLKKNHEKQNKIDAKQILMANVWGLTYHLIIKHWVLKEKSKCICLSAIVVNFQVE